ncbi:MAG: hypothetical protein ACREN5_12675, partial [Gemmatimonadales bacterium]
MEAERRRIATGSTDRGDLPPDSTEALEPLLAMGMSTEGRHMRRNTTLSILGTLAALTTTIAAAGWLAVAPASADPLDVVDCTADVGDPPLGSLGWDLADNNNRWCATERVRTTYGNPAYYAAYAANIAAGSPASQQLVYDPFRDVYTRWAGQRGDFEEVTWTGQDGAPWRAMLYSPLDIDAPLPGILLACHVCAGTFQSWQWAAQA